MVWLTDVCALQSNLVWHFNVNGFIDTEIFTRNCSHPVWNSFVKWFYNAYTLRKNWVNLTQLFIIEILMPSESNWPSFFSQCTLTGESWLWAILIYDFGIKSMRWYPNSVTELYQIMAKLWRVLSTNWWCFRAFLIPKLLLPFW